LIIGKRKADYATVVSEVLTKKKTPGTFFRLKRQARASSEPSSMEKLGRSATIDDDFQIVTVQEAEKRKRDNARLMKEIAMRFEYFSKIGEKRMKIDKVTNKLHNPFVNENKELREILTSGQYLDQIASMSRTENKIETTNFLQIISNISSDSLFPRQCYKKMVKFSFAPSPYKVQERQSFKPFSRTRTSDSSRIDAAETSLQLENKPVMIKSGFSKKSNTNFPAKLEIEKIVLPELFEEQENSRGAAKSQTPKSKKVDVSFDHIRPRNYTKSQFSGLNFSSGEIPSNSLK